MIRDSDHPSSAPNDLRASVVVPARNCPDSLRRVLTALHASDLPPQEWELIVVDDSSTDSTAEVARTMADSVIILAGGPRGPAYARNRGAEAAMGANLVFVDADVCLHADALRLMVETLEAGSGAPSAVFGAYDTHPEASGIVSQYRNLLHHYVHLTNGGAAETFWAGCGAVRRSAFTAVGMFDEQQFRRPQIEDIDLGYRLSDSGERILLIPEIQGTHLKRWTLGKMLATDYSDRAVPWTRLVLQRRALATSVSLNLRPTERIFTALAGVAVLLAVASLVRLDPRFLVAAVIALLCIIVGNLGMLAWFARERGIVFAIAVVPLRLLFYIVSAAGAASAIVIHLAEQLRRSSFSFRGVTS
ncbi:MAG: glycosyltransferase [Gemmatimonadaceae bacterium]